MPDSPGTKGHRKVALRKFLRCGALALEMPIGPGTACRSSLRFPLPVAAAPLGVTPGNSFGMYDFDKLARTVQTREVEFAFDSRRN